MARMIATNNSKFVRNLCVALGVDYSLTQRIIIDIGLDSAIVAHVQLLVDDSKLQLLEFPVGLEITRVDKDPGEL